MLHLINWFIIETLVEITFWPNEIWETQNLVDFGHYVQGTADWALKIGNSSVATINQCGELNGIKFAKVEGSNLINRGKLNILPPELHKQTNNYKDIESVLEKYFKVYLENSEALFAFVQGDEQVFTLIWHLKKKKKINFTR